MKKIVAAALAFVAMGAAVAFADPHADREALMKQNGAAMKALTAISQAPTFDAAAAREQLQILVDNAQKTPGLFPPGSDQGDPHALPVIWTDQVGFKAASDKLAFDAKAAQGATDGPSFAMALKNVGGDCGGCHKTYRLPPPPAPAAAAPAAAAPAAAPATTPAQ